MVNPDVWSFAHIETMKREADEYDPSQDETLPASILEEIGVAMKESRNRKRGVHTNILTRDAYVSMKINMDLRLKHRDRNTLVVVVQGISVHAPRQGLGMKILALLLSLFEDDKRFSAMEVESIFSPECEALCVSFGMVRDEMWEYGCHNYWYDLPARDVARIE